MEELDLPSERVKFGLSGLSSSSKKLLPKSIINLCLMLNLIDFLRNLEYILRITVFLPDYSLNAVFYRFNAINNGKESGFFPISVEKIGKAIP